MAQPTYQNLLDENRQLRQENQRLREQNRQLHLRVDALEAQVLDHNDPTHGQSLRQLSAGRGMDVILEMLANINLATDLEVVAQGGTIVVIGNRGSIEINPRMLMAKEVSLLGMVVLNAPPADLASIHAALYAGLENKTLRPVIAAELTLSDAAKAHRLVMEARHLGKIVLVP
jgi:NADPH2:quinone reductase